MMNPISKITSAHKNPALRPTVNQIWTQNENQFRSRQAKERKALESPANHILRAAIRSSLKFSFKIPKIYADLNNKNLNASLAENLEDLKDGDIDIDRKIEIVSNLRVTHPGSSYLAEAMLIKTQSIHAKLASFWPKSI